VSVREDLVEGLIVTPEEVRQLTHKYVDELSDKNKMSMGVRSGLKNLDLLLNPLREGQMRVIMGRPSNGKTALMAHFNRDTAQWLIRSKNKEKGPPIFVSAEMAIEELALREVSNYIPLDSVLIERGEAPSWEDVHNGIDQTAMDRPTIYIGHTLMKGGRRPKLSVENIMRCIETVQDKFGKTPALISVDYAQRLKLDKQTRDRRGEVSEIVETIKDMALRFAVPVQLGSQVGRQVDDRIPPVPTLSDAKETANLEETADSVLAVMRPMRYYEIGETIKKAKDGQDLTCSENLFFIEVLKQRQGKIGGCWCYFDMRISQLADLEIVDLNDPKHWG
jgi:replicative DNA helicase